MKNRYLLALSLGAILLISSLALGMLLNVLFPALKAEYETPAFRPWTDPLMSLFFAYPVVLGILLTYVWLKSRKSWKNGLDFGISIGVLTAVPAFLVNYSSFTFSLLMICSWVFLGFVNTLIAGLALEKLESCFN
ncbi:MAG: hypothetical protein U0R44_05200 [Candidatus Micrarchaeia archaeon]